MKFGGDDHEHLLVSIRRGEAFLILGAGASATSLNAAQKPVKLSKALAADLAGRAGLAHKGENLTDVLEAVRGNYLSDVQIIEILSREYKNLTPSRELENLFRISWRRVYTWNIDDAIENLRPGRLVQRHRPFNGMIDRVAEYEGLNSLHVVSLHGQIRKPEHKFILTEAEYFAAINQDWHQWYKRLAQDYLAFCPIFVGTELSEPILLAELERAKREHNSVAGRAYLVTPSELGAIESAKLRAKGIVHLRGSLGDFTEWLNRQFPAGLDPKGILARTNEFSDARILETISTSDIETAHSLRPINPVKIKDRVSEWGSAKLNRLAGQYWSGFPVTWELVAANVPARLKATEGLYAQLEAVVTKGDRLLVVTGQAASGKTTAIMQCILRYVSEHPKVVAYEVSEVRSVRLLLGLLKKLHPDEHVLLYLGDLFLYSDNLKEDLERLGGQPITVISSARSGEWNDHFARHLNGYGPNFELHRFNRADYDELINCIERFVAAPAFNKLPRTERVSKLSRSHGQLLIALREVTESQNFDQIITSEYESLPDREAKRVFCLAGLGTLARVGLGLDKAAEIFKSKPVTRSLDSALQSLDGIVNLTLGERLFARHELYVRHILENVGNYPVDVASPI